MGAAQTKPRTVVVLEWEANRWAVETNRIMEDAHRQYHADAAYPADWERCWAEPCRSLNVIHREIVDAVEDAWVMSDDDEAATDP